MNDPKPMGSVAELLLNYVSTTHEHDVNFSIAVTMLNHYRELGSMSAAEIAELCNLGSGHGAQLTVVIQHRNGDAEIHIVFMRCADIVQQKLRNRTHRLRIVHLYPLLFAGMK